MATSKQIQHIARNPKAHMDFVMSGRLPATVTPRSPLIDLLTKISPRDRAAIIGLTVGPTLGYSGSRQFHTAEAALRWIRPDTEMLASQSWPAESWRDKRFHRKLSLDDLLGMASNAPPNIRERYPQLCPAGATMKQAHKPHHQTHLNHEQKIIRGPNPGELEALLRQTRGGHP